MAVISFSSSLKLFLSVIYTYVLEKLAIVALLEDTQGNGSSFTLPAKIYNLTIAYHDTIAVSIGNHLQTNQVFIGLLDDAADSAFVYLGGVINDLSDVVFTCWIQ